MRRAQQSALAENGSKGPKILEKEEDYLLSKLDTKI
jgi:hypothetical protein